MSATRVPLPDCTSVLVRNLATGVQRELRIRSNNSSYSHPAVSGSKVVWVQHLGIDKNVLANWSNMPYDICGADVSNLDKPVYFTIATDVGKRDPYPYRSPGRTSTTSSISPATSWYGKATATSMPPISPI